MSWKGLLKQNQTFEFFNDNLDLDDQDEKYDEYTNCAVKWELEIRFGGSNQGSKEYFEVLYNIKELSVITGSGEEEKIDNGKIDIDTSSIDFSQPISAGTVELYNGIFKVIFY
ncbi:hypothetical protein QKV95_gp124 [Poseidoniales virus YSH_150918]|uniref:Uncharacterized protein n=1 Tax=Poseidoniales virus YSH_150918 TaxID=3071324 RepID=A0A976UBU0_9CAUD|nr:hypothetical protein QKV95_gp124 [Yangshan Harbor Poseidoniales virus]UVF62601.1 hypothetical protein [Poseidoniales virus YSH_150918]